MKYALALVGGLLGGAILGGVFTSGSTCCGLIAQGIRSKAPASVQAIGDVVNIWPAFVGLGRLA